MASILALAAALRVTHLGWDGVQQLHPDERAILFVTQELTLPPTLAGLAPAHSPLNPLRTPTGVPRPYPYGHLELYLNAAMAATLTIPCEALPAACASLAPGGMAARLLNAGGLTRFDHLTVTGRLLAGLAGTLTVLGAGLLARRVFGPAAGLLAAAFTALAAQHIQQAHFGTADTLLAAFSTLAVWQAVILSQDGRHEAAWWAGAFAGLALGSKASAGLLAVPLAAATVLRRDTGAAWRMALGAALAFALSNPYALLDPLPSLTGATTQARMAAGALDWPFTWAYRGTLPVVYGLSQQARWLLGPALTLAAVGGLLAATVRGIRTRERALSVIVVWAWAALLVFGGQAVKFPRYLLPANPALFALAAGLFAGDQARGPRSVRAVGAALVVACTAVYAGAFTAMYAQPHPWVAASEWLRANLPAGEVVLSERGDDALPLGGSGSLDTRQIDPLAEPDDDAKLAALLEQLEAGDVLVIASRRLYGTLPRVSDRYPLTTAAYHALFAGDLGYVLEARFTRYPELGGRPLYDDPFRAVGLPAPPGALPVHGFNLGPADESFVVYDHPLVLVFANRARLSAEAMAEAVYRHADALMPPR